jgi:DNA-binding MarR family transcriptional regulator
MAKSDSPFSRAVKRAVNQSTENGLLLGNLPPTALKILDIYRAGGTAQQAAAQCHCSKQNVSKHTKMLLKRGFIRLQTYDVFKIYSLTPLGQSIFTTSESAGEAVALEDHAFKFAIIRNESCPLDWKKLGDPRGWQKLGVHVDGLRVEKTSKSIIIHPGKMVGFNPDILLFDSGRAVQKCKDILEGRFGMLLSPEGVPLHKPIIRFYSEEAKEDVKHGTVIVQGDGAIDNSPPEHIPHEEYSGVERAKARILLPDTLKAVNNKLSDFKSEFVEYKASNEVRDEKQNQVLCKIDGKLDGLISTVITLASVITAFVENQTANITANKNLQDDKQNPQQITRASNSRLYEG